MTNKLRLIEWIINEASEQQLFALEDMIEYEANIHNIKRLIGKEQFEQLMKDIVEKSNENE